MVNNEEEKGWKLYSIIISIMTIILVISIIVLEIIAPQIIKSMFPGFDQVTLDKTVLFTRIVLPAQLFFYNGGIISAILLSKKKFLVPALAPLIYNISIIIFGLIFAKYGMIGFAIGALIGAFVGPFGLQFLALRKEVHFKINFNIKDKDFINFLKKSIPIMLGLILVTLDDWLSKRYGSFLDKGTISYLNNSRRLVLVPIGLFAQANAQAILPFLSEYFARKDFKQFNDLARKSLTLVFFVTTFAASWFLVFHYEIIRLIYQRGAYNLQDTLLTSNIFFMLSLSIPFWASIIIISRFYYAIHNTKTPMIIGAIMTLLSLPLYSLLSSMYKADGLALTVSIVKVLYFLTILVFYKKFNKEFELTSILKDLIKIISFFIFLTTSFYFIKVELKNINWWLVLILGSILQLVITLYLAKYIKVDAYNEFKIKYLNRILRKLKLIR
jgi:putative peptidoglycan lipid II flippase